MTSLIDSRPRLGRLGLGTLCVLLFAGLLFATPAGRRPFWSSDEARFALLAQDILDHGRWLVPELRGELYLNKPQLFFWSIALVSLPAGRVTELSSAVPSVVSAVATVAAVVAIGTLLWGGAAGPVAGLILATTPAFYVFSHQVLSDVMMTAWITWAIYFALRAAAGGWRLGPLVAFYVCVGAAVLAKGPAGFAGLAAVLGAFLASDGLAGLRRLRPGLGLAVLALLMLPWVLPYLTRSDGRFTSGVLLGHYSTHYFGHELLPRVRAFLHPFPNFLPWAVLLLPAVFWWRMKPDVGRKRIGVATLVLAGAFALSGTHRARYMLPVYPGLALLAAEFVVRAGQAGGRHLLRAGWLAVGGITLIAAALVSAGTIRFTGEDHAFIPDAPLEVAVIAGLAAATGLAAVLGAWRWRHGAVAVAAGLGGILLVQGLTYPGRYARDNDVRPLASVAARHAPSNAVVVAYPDLRLSYDFYLGRRVVEVSAIDAVSRLLDRAPGSVLITSRERWTSLAPVLPPSWRVLESRRVGEREMVVVGSEAS